MNIFAHKEGYQASFNLAVITPVQKKTSKSINVKRLFMHSKDLYDKIHPLTTFIYFIKFIPLFCALIRVTMAVTSLKTIKIK